MAQRLVVIGGGAVGMSVAAAARRIDPAWDIVVLEATGHAAYGLCGIPYYLAGLVRRADELLVLDLSYAPPDAPVYEPLLLVAQAAALSVSRVAV